MAPNLRSRGRRPPALAPDNQSGDESENVNRAIEAVKHAVERLSTVRRTVEIFWQKWSSLEDLLRVHDMCPLRVLEPHTLLLIGQAQAYISSSITVIQSLQETQWRLRLEQLVLIFHPTAFASQMFKKNLKKLAVDSKIQGITWETAWTALNRARQERHGSYSRADRAHPRWKPSDIAVAKGFLTGTELDSSRTGTEGYRPERDSSQAVEDDDDDDEDEDQDQAAPTGKFESGSDYHPSIPRTDRATCSAADNDIAPITDQERSPDHIELCRGPVTPRSRRSSKAHHFPATSDYTLSWSSSPPARYAAAKLPGEISAPVFDSSNRALPTLTEESVCLSPALHTESEQPSFGLYYFQTPSGKQQQQQQRQEGGHKRERSSDDAHVEHAHKFLRTSDADPGCLLETQAPTDQIAMAASSLAGKNFANDTALAMSLATLNPDDRICVLDPTFLQDIFQDSGHLSSSHSYGQTL